MKMVHVNIVFIREEAKKAETLTGKYSQAKLHFQHSATSQHKAKLWAARNYLLT